MRSNHSAAWQLLLIMMSAGFIGMYAMAEENNPKQDPKTNPVQEKSDDIWKEFSFASEEDLQLTEKQIQEILDQFKKTDPAKAVRFEELRHKDAQKFITAIRDEIKQQRKKTAPEQPRQEQWKEALSKKHETFLVWFKKQYPEDHEELIELRVTDPEKYVQRSTDLMKVYEPIQRMEKYSSKLAGTMKKNLDLQKRRDALLLQIRIASKEQQPELIEELGSVVSQRFDTIVVEKQLQYQWLRKRLNDLTKKVETRAKELESLNKNKKKAVQDRMNELMERTEKVNWD
ncbi:MAG: hypothetical protein OEV87_04580 [Phycisphaerae bacterium]|nr:hypothetical protein [Phycisphaerae bacterium]